MKPSDSYETLRRTNPVVEVWSTLFSTRRYYLTIYIFFYYTYKYIKSVLSETFLFISDFLSVLLQGFEFTGKENMGFKPQFLPLTHLTQILSDVEQRGTECVCVCVCVFVCVYEFVSLVFILHCCVSWNVIHFSVVWNVRKMMDCICFMCF